MPVAIPWTASSTVDIQGEYKISGSSVPYSTSTGIQGSGTMNVAGNAPMTGSAVSAMRGIMMMHDLDTYTTAKALYMDYGNLADDMQVLREGSISGLLTKTGKSVYERSWTVSNSNSYHGNLFTFLDYDARFDLEQSFDRKVTLKAVES
jgi:hypothetical protein